MIGYLSGKLLFKQPPELILDVGGVGYELQAPMTTFYDLPDTGETVTLFTHLAISDNAHNLYGFIDVSSKSLFRVLIKISGVGPKLALTILSGISVTEFAQAIAADDVEALVRLPGIGKKTAQRLIVEMKDPLENMELGITANREPSKHDATGEAFNALQALGYKDKEIRQLLSRVSVDATTTEEIIRQALKGGST